MFRPSLIPTALVGGALVVGLWLGGGSLVRGHDAAAQVPTPQATVTPGTPMVAPQPALPQLPAIPTAGAPGSTTNPSSTLIVSLTDVPGVVASVHRVEGLIIVVSNVGVAIQQDLTATAPAAAAR